MYNILIVDDEEIERRGIVSLIKKNNFELNINEAENGEEALEYIKNKHIDILFTDIKMPFMNGIELSEKSLEINPELTIIFYSAYSEFEYARKAIELKVVQYILKPIEIDNFIDVMKETINICDKNEKNKEANKLIIKYKKDKILLDIVSGQDCNHELIERINKANIDILDNKILILLLDFEQKFFDTYNIQFEKKIDEWLNSNLYYYLNLNEFQSLLFIKVNNDRLVNENIEVVKKLKFQIEKVYITRFCIVVGNIIDNITKIHSEYNEIEKSLDEKFFVNKNIIILPKHNTYDIDDIPEFIKISIENINQYIELKDVEGLKDAIIVMFDTIGVSNKNISSMYLKYICMEIIKNIYEKLTLINNSNPYEEKFQEIFFAQSLNQIKQIFLNLFKDKEFFVSKINNNSVIEDIKSIIRKEYMIDISLQAIAEEVYLTPSYLSYLFKKETGMSLIQYITEFRLNKSKQLLSNTNMKVVDIASSVGYSNVSYFGSVFKNHCGISPMKYREKCKI